MLAKSVIDHHHSDFTYTGLFPTFDFAVHGAQFGPYMKQFDWQGSLDARIADAVAFLKAEGATKIAAIGFCW